MEPLSVTGHPSFEYDQSLLVFLSSRKAKKIRRAHLGAFFIVSGSTNCMKRGATRSVPLSLEHPRVNIISIFVNGDSLTGLLFFFLQLNSLF